MGVLTEYLKTEAEHLRAEAGNQSRAVEEWTAAVRALFGKLQQWLAEADSESRLLTVREMVAEPQEPRLGVYATPALEVRLGSRKAMIVPRARYVLATIKAPDKEPQRADGLVEIKDGASADWYLFRLKSDNGDEWFIQNATAWNAALNRHGLVDPLDRERFEAALLRILK
ncbi:MAG: hypothetical protein JWO38_5167 [Gemmataceae bacterium]|nr:hypothetical protein [Gemmataceae bacterium]